MCVCVFVCVCVPVRAGVSCLGAVVGVVGFVGVVLTLLLLIDARFVLQMHGLPV